MGFQIPSRTDLAAYFGRSIGALAISTNIAAARAAMTGKGVAEFIAFIFTTAVLMALIRASGARRKIQPLNEPLEIGVRIAMALGALAVYPG